MVSVERLRSWKHGKAKVERSNNATARRLPIRATQPNNERQKISICLLIICFFFTPSTSLAEVTANSGETVWADGKLPGISHIEGNWLWDSNMQQGEIPSHTDGISEGLHSHLFRTDSTVELDNNSRIIQYVFLDPEHRPSGIMMKFLAQGQDQTSVYWEGEEEVFADTNEYITAWHMGLLPQEGEWIELIVDFKQMDIAGITLEGISFITANGRLWWGKTVVIQDKS